MIHCATTAELQALCLQWKSAGDKIVFTNGVFDILHQGHVTYLEKARELGDRLVVAINDDASVRQLNKGAERPINPELARA
ncbi:MAG: adenylyltransferase/cytidyltransferase family protein, partial [Flavobacteriales bacterium]